MPSAREQAREGRLERVGLQVERGDVALEVVDGNERQPSPPGEALRGGDPDEERADEPRALRHRDPLDTVELHVGVVERGANHGRDELQVPT